MGGEKGKCSAVLLIQGEKNYKCSDRGEGKEMFSERGAEERYSDGWKRKSVQRS